MTDKLLGKDEGVLKSVSDPNRYSKTKRIEHWHIIAALMVLYDFIMIHASYFLVLWMRFDCVYSAIPERFFITFRSTVTIYSVVCIVVFLFTNLYQSMWRFASFSELIRVFLSSIGMSVAYSVVITLFVHNMPLSYHVYGAALQFFFLLLIRFSYRLLIYLRTRGGATKEKKSRVMIIGAGSSGQFIIKDINRNYNLSETVVCVIDDNPNKWNRYIEGIPIVGGRDDILANVQKYNVDKIFFAISKASAEAKKDILNICKESGCELKQIPALEQIVKGQVTVSSMKDVSIEDLLGREPIRADLNEVFEFINGKTVLVTGGGGSIGSELCRQIAEHNPKQLIIFDIYENSAYDIQLELKKKHPELKLEVLIGSVRDSRRMFEIFEDYKPQIVYHAAAHKHVPLMEDSPNEAIKNNALGTYKTAYAAMVHGCERFVLISTDKAVNPTNIMGASKRICEMIIQAFDAKIKAGRAADIPQLFTHSGLENADKDGNGEIFRRIKTEFVAVRFGNVLGSNGSVIPVFKEQIKNGGPVTVTHPDIIRYFMTIPEAVSLVLLAGTYANGGQIFVLDMGSPMKIDTLARNLIKLSGFKPDVDIMIEYTGLRPGEKLYEEKLMAEEGLRKTENDLIHIGFPIPFDNDTFLKQLKELMAASYSNKVDIRQRVMQIVETYKPAGIGGAGSEESRTSKE